MSCQVASFKSFMPSAQRNKTEIKLKQNSFETVLFKQKKG